MSLEHVPKFVWIPIAVLLWVFIGFIILVAFTSYRVKSLEIDLLNVAIKVEYVGQQLSIAQQNINTTMGVIDGLTKQLTQFQNSLQPITNIKQTAESSDVRQPRSIPTKVVSTPTKGSNGINQSIVQQLQIQKVRLEGINGELKHIQDNLHSSVQKNTQ